MLKVENLKKVFRTEEIETIALNGVTFEVKEGEFVAIMGPSAAASPRCSISWGFWTIPPRAAIRCSTTRSPGSGRKTARNSARGILGLSSSRST